MKSLNCGMMQSVIVNEGRMMENSKHHVSMFCVFPYSYLLNFPLFLYNKQNKETYLSKDKHSINC